MMSSIEEADKILFRLLDGLQAEGRLPDTLFEATEQHGVT